MNDLAELTKNAFFDLLLGNFDKWRHPLLTKHDGGGGLGQNDVIFMIFNLTILKYFENIKHKIIQKHL